ncbi:hypothetical protein UB46_20810 [Burkholderiaceae bacterium 16]|nr:hypothetical protein UB46_20810 [Burkholderiaceae bacterium 16]
MVTPFRFVSISASHGWVTLGPSYHARVMQAPDGAAIQAQHLVQHLVGVRAQQRRRGGGLAFHLRCAHRRAGGDVVADARGVDALEDRLVAAFTRGSPASSSGDSAICDRRFGAKANG